ncbi:MAG: hypothetical protein RSC29_02635 [Oscillospiraceae bacterium]
MIKLRLNEQHKNSGEIDELLENISAVPGACDEIWLASDYGFPPINIIEESSKSMVIAAEKMRRKGLTVSLQISNTIGHGEYAKYRNCEGLVYKNSPVVNLVDSSGVKCDYAFCYNDKYFLDYIYKYVNEFSRCKPYCVWVDDDLRPTNHYPVKIGCFCDSCIEKFNVLYNEKFTRESLVYEINFGDTIWRKRYSNFVKTGISNLAETITKAVMNISPESFMGYQYSTTNFTGTGVEYILDKFYEGSGKPPKVRPGGGFYDDHRPYEMVDKALYLQYQNAITPNYVSEKCAEIENTPDVSFGKTIYSTCLESSLYLACGNNSLSYATLMNVYEPMVWHKQMFEMFAQHRPYWERIISHNNNASNGGICLYTSKNSYLKPSTVEFDWIKQHWNEANEMLRVGMPLCYDEKFGCGYLISENIVDCLQDDDIEYLLEKNVVLDSGAFHKIINRGFGDCVSATTKKFDYSQCCEVFSNHAVNHGFEGKQWRGLNLTGSTESYLICDKDGTTEEVSHFVKNLDNSLQGCINAIVKTYKNSKWAVMGYGLWNGILSFDKRNQILNVIDYISENKMPVLLKSRNQVAVFPQVDDLGSVVSVSLLNCSIEDAFDMPFHIRNARGTIFTNYNAFENETRLKCTVNSNESIVTVPSIKAWHITTIFISEEEEK